MQDTQLAQSQRAQLHAQIWKMANEVRGAVDGWDFKQFVLGMLFYRFASEQFVFRVEGGDSSIGYAQMADEEISAVERDMIVRRLGYYIAPSQLFQNVVRTATQDLDLNSHLKNIFNAIEGSALGYPSEKQLQGLFADFDTTSTRLGNTVQEKTRRLLAVMQGVAELDFGPIGEAQIDVFGDAYEFLISNYAANAGKSGGEFFTPQSVSRLIARLAMHGQREVRSIYDPACGSGSLLLQARHLERQRRFSGNYYGQEINLTTYNLARMNMFLHGVNYSKFDLQHGDTLLRPAHKSRLGFDAIVSNPPYSVNWVGDADPTLINDDRFAPAGVLAPRSKADYAFILHILDRLSERGRAAVVCFPGIFYRGGKEQKIRRWLVEGNYVESVIALPPNLFYGTSIAVNIMTLSKAKGTRAIRFIDASGEDFYSKETNNNVLRPEHIDHIEALFVSAEEEPHVARSVPFEEVAAQDFNLSVSSYIEARDTREAIDIHALNEELRQRVARIDELRRGIDQIIMALEEEGAAS